MRQVFFFLSLALMLTSSFKGQAAHASMDEIDWYQSFQEAAEKSSKTNKPLVILFTGSDWCAWCKKLEKEVFNTPEFVEKVGDKFVYMKADFPRNSYQPKELRDQNEELKHKYEVRGFPTVVVLDEKLQKIATAGYQSGGGDKYAEYLLKVVSEYGSYQKNLNKLSSNNLSPAELEQLYEKACELGQDDDLQAILNTGLNCANNTFFLKEKFRLLADEGEINSPDARDIRKKLLAADPANTHKIHYDVAVVEFQVLSEKLEAGQGTAKDTCAPLLTYIDQFGEKDRDNRWRIEMTVAQTFLSQNDSENALNHARTSYEFAPENMKNDIAKAINSIETYSPTKDTASLE